MSKLAGGQQRKGRRWRRPGPSIVIAGAAVFVALGGSAVGDSMIQAASISTGAVTSRAIKNGAIEPADLSSRTLGLIPRTVGSAGARGDPGTAGVPGSSGANGPTGANGANGVNGGAGANGAPGSSGAAGPTGAPGSNGAAGTNGAPGANGAAGVNGANGPNGANGTNGTDGVDGTNGTNGVNGTIKPLYATAGTVALPTAAPPITVVTLAVPAGSYVVLAKTQLFQSGAGDTVECVLRSGTTPIDQASMKTLPALASIPASLQAVVTTTSPSSFSLDCDVMTANGTASSNSLIAIPTG
jgi:Collagen triple helix repeat (20 copies)